ncbi:zinc ribbon domain-containing protein [Sanguibacter sp. A247]|uniref:zinc ribbon domain-containing protein n=1 Tax=unclassified Sanguibacter TaxID=2645534 RepID=UPI003FD73923
MATAPAADQARLLDVQALDTRLDQIAHKRSHHPTLARIAELDGQLADLHGSLVASRTAVADLRRELTKSEDDVTQVRERTERNQKRLDSGAVSAKDATALLSEIESLAHRQATLEEVELDVMERLEAHEVALAGVEQAHAALVAAREGVVAERDAAYAELDATSTDVAAQRAAAAEGLDATLMATYEKLRARMGGVAVAALRHGRSEASGMPVSPVELARIKALGPDELVYCEDTGRLLVRGEDAF